jgi:putative peptidoglycan lipid II flippase
LTTDNTGVTETAPSGAGSSAAVLASGPGAGRIAAGVASGALLIAVLTAASRLLGLGRTVVFAQSVGAGCLGTAYVTANQVPNLIYELALGGALTSAMVPVLARAAQRSGSDPAEKTYVTQVASALLTWSAVILAPVTVAIMVAARPIAGLLIPVNPNATCARPAMVSATTDMIIAFAPQILFYGFSVVLSGLLQAYRRFTGPTLAPVLANVVMISSYLIFAVLDKNLPITRTPLAAQLVLSIGTTMNIGTLVLVALPPTWRLHLRIRPTLRFPPGVMRLAGGLALVGLLEFLAGDLTGVVIIDLANGHGDTGALVLNSYVTLVFSSMCSVLPVAIVTSVYPVLAASAEEDFDRTCAGVSRAVVLMSWLGSAVIVAVSVPAAHVLAKQPDQVSQLAQAFLVAAPGVVGYAIIVSLSRVMFVLGRLRAAGIGLVAAPLLQIAVSVPLVELTPPHLAVAALAAGSTVSLLVVAVPMVIAIRRFRGDAAIAGLGRATRSGLLAGLAAGAAGAGVDYLAPAGGTLFEAATGALATALALLVFGVVAYCLDRDDLQMVATRLAAARLRLRQWARPRA